MYSFAFVFPGQGSQSLGMLSELKLAYPDIFQTVFDEASEELKYDLWKLIEAGPAEVLDKTVHTQPALLASSYAVWKIIQIHGKQKPVLLAGHSLGEYTALLCADVFSFKEAIRLVAARGQFMQEAVAFGEGALAAIVGLEDEAVRVLCEKASLPGEVLSPANFNSIGQVVIAGHTQAVERALVLAKSEGAKLAKLLPVSVPSHCSLMKLAAERLADFLKTISVSKPAIPVLSNVDVTLYEHPDQIRDGLVRQLTMPVRWVETIKMFEKCNITDIVECGPGKVLNGLNKRITHDVRLMNTNDLDSLQAVLAVEEVSHVTKE